MGSLSVLQVAISGRLVHERVRAKLEQIPAAPGRLAREVVLVLEKILSLEGRVICGSCGGVFAAELGHCPQCGGPVPARREVA